MSKKKSENFTNARLKHMMSRPVPDYPVSVPFFRGRISRESLDFGLKITVAHLFRTKNITQYIVVIDGELWSYAAGMNKIDAELRRRNPPVARIY